MHVNKRPIAWETLTAVAFEKVECSLFTVSLILSDGKKSMRQVEFFYGKRLTANNRAKI